MTIELLLIMITVGFICNMITWMVEPIQLIKDFVYANIKFIFKIQKLIKELIFNILNCTLCLSFWTGCGLLWFFPIWYIPFLTCLFALIIQKILRE